MEKAYNCHNVTAKGIVRDLHAHSRNTENREHAREMARMARDATRDALADIAIIRRQVEHGAAFA